MTGSLIRFQTELAYNLNPRFTKWLAKSGILQEPFVLIDVGVLGGENQRWHFLGDHLVVHGFDASKEVVETLSKANAGSLSKHYHWFAIGNGDGEREFFYNPANPSSSSFFEFPGTHRRTVPVRRLDTLLKDGTIPKADFLKVDVEGHERDVFLGANTFLAAGILGVEVETSFATNAASPEPNFDVIRKLLIKRGFAMSDLNFNRVRGASYQSARKARGLPELPLEGAGKPATFNVLHCRDPFAEFSQTLRVDQILKLMAIYELYGLNDVAVDVAMTFYDNISQRIDVERAIELLCDNDGGAVREYLDEVRRLKRSITNMNQWLHTLHRALSSNVFRRAISAGAIAELEGMKRELASLIVTKDELPQPLQFPYEGHAQIDSVIPQALKDITRAHGGAILRISPGQEIGLAELHVRVLLNCYCPETNSVRVAVFRDGCDEPLAVLTQDLIPAQTTVVDQDFVTSAMDASVPPILEIRVGLAHPGVTLSLNHVSGQNNNSAFASAVRLQWIPLENSAGRTAAIQSPVP